MMVRINLDSTEWTADVYTSRYVENVGTIEILGEKGERLLSVCGGPEDIERLEMACKALRTELEETARVRSVV